MSLLPSLDASALESLIYLYLLDRAYREEFYL